MQAIIKFTKQKQPINADIRGVKFGSIPMFLIQTRANSFYENPRYIENINTRSGN